MCSCWQSRQLIPVKYGECERHPVSLGDQLRLLLGQRSVAKTSRMLTEFRSDWSTSPLSLGGAEIRALSMVPGGSSADEVQGFRSPPLWRGTRRARNGAIPVRRATHIITSSANRRRRGVFEPVSGRVSLEAAAAASGNAFTPFIEKLNRFLGGLRVPNTAVRSAASGPGMLLWKMLRSCSGFLKNAARTAAR
jgi:hypothetical protein